MSCARMKWSMAFASFLTASAGFAGPFDFAGSVQRFFHDQLLEGEAAVDLTKLRKTPQAGLDFADTRDTLSALHQLLQDRGLHPYVALSPLKITRRQSFGLTNGDSLQAVSDYQYMVGFYPICGQILRTIDHGDGNTLVTGSVPVVDQVAQFANDDWPSLQDSSANAVREIARLHGFAENHAQVLLNSRCLANEQGHLIPVWNLILSFGELQFSVWSTSSRVIYASQRYFDALATVRAYDPNKVKGVLRDFSIVVNGDGSLTNEFFAATNANGMAPARNEHGAFIYSDSDPHFAEASTFAYANQQYDFVKSMGYTWIGEKPINIAVHAKIKGSSNNAFYLPGIQDIAAPVISVGDGDGVVFKNLAFDADVVGHEFGHHVIFQSVTSNDGESGVIHEGLADFLAMSRSANSCLAESICPDQSAQCAVRAKCLRTAENTLNYNDFTYSTISDSHRKGQLVSGFLWDLRKTNAISGETLTRYVLEAIPYFPSRGSFKALIAGLLFVDQKHGGIYKNAIIDAATARGLSPENLDIYMTDLEGSLGGDKQIAPGGGDDSGSEKNFLGCGTIGGHAGQSASAGFILILLMMPLFLRVVRLSKK